MTDHETALVLPSEAEVELLGHDAEAAKGYAERSLSDATPFESQSLNRYSYVMNDPVNYVDPTGHNLLTWGNPVGYVFSYSGSGADGRSGPTSHAERQQNWEDAQDDKNEEVDQATTGGQGTGPGVLLASTNNVGLEAIFGSEPTRQEPGPVPVQGDFPGQNPWTGDDDGMGPDGLLSAFMGNWPVIGPLSRIADGMKDILGGAAAMAGGYVVAPIFLAPVVTVLSPVIGVDTAVAVVGASFTGGRVGLKVAGHGTVIIGRGVKQGFGQAQRALTIAQVGF